eukprot:m.335582 g.335582  ORF g.335582 m.335582 type:complete len:188 (+) comp17632_c0_seq1:4251-4814(+)
MPNFAFDHDPWAPDEKEDLYSDNEIESKDEEDIPPPRQRLFSVQQIDPAGHKVVIKNVTDERMSLDGWFARDGETGKTSAPWSGVEVNPGEAVTLWTSPGLPGSNAPDEEDTQNVFWRNKTNRKPRRQPIFKSGESASIELVDNTGEVVDIGHVNPDKRFQLRTELSASTRRVSNRKSSAGASSQGD